MKTEEKGRKRKEEETKKGGGGRRKEKESMVAFKLHAKKVVENPKSRLDGDVGSWECQQDTEISFYSGGERAKSICRFLSAEMMKE